MTIEQIIDYVMYAPHNTNRAVLAPLLKELVESGGSNDKPIVVAAGLYETGSNYTVLKKPWNELVAEGIIRVENGAVNTVIDEYWNENSSSPFLAGDLVLPDDGTITKIGSYSETKDWCDCGFVCCSELTGIIIPNSVSNIGYCAFCYCSKLSTIEIPDSVVAIEGGAFGDCTALENITFLGNAPTLGDGALSTNSPELVINYYVCTTGWDESPWTDYAIKAIETGVWVTDVEATCTTDGLRHTTCNHCNKTITKVIPAGHDYVNGVCSRCGDIKIIASGTCGTNINWSLNAEYTFTLDGTGNMDSYSFNSAVPWKDYRRNIKNVVIPEGITSIGNNAFYDCQSITSIIIPDSVTSIGSSAFSRCINLKSINIPEGVTKISSYTFDSCTSLTEIIIPESVTQIGDGAFSGCTFTNIVIPDGVTSMGASVFHGCDNLTSIVLPEGLTYLGQQAFYSCTNLTSVVIPASLGDLYRTFVFGYCTNLTSITYTGTVEQWNNLSKKQDSQAWNEGVPATEVVCSDGVVAL